MDYLFLVEDSKICYGCYLSDYPEHFEEEYIEDTNNEPISCECCGLDEMSDKLNYDLHNFPNILESKSKFVKVNYTSKRALDDDFSTMNIEDYTYFMECTGYDYITLSSNYCNQCFLYGIFKSINIKDRLPYLRRDIGYFRTKINDKSLLTKYNDIISKLVIPKVYHIDYYRTTDFTLIENKYTISVK